MKQVMPQELEVWYLLPAIRRELAKNLIDYCKLSQRKTAKMLGITESAISQYLKSKRGKRLHFNDVFKSELVKAAHRINEKPSNLLKEIQGLCSMAKKEKILCNLHKEHSMISHDCRICGDF